MTNQQEQEPVSAERLALLKERFANQNGGPYNALEVERSTLNELIDEVERGRVESEFLAARVQFFVDTLQGMKARIEWSQSKEAAAHTAAYPIEAQYAMLYATICDALGRYKEQAK